jgi:UDP-glucose 4-epimerase
MGFWSSTLEEVVNKTILVTGGLGCLGSHLCKYLLNCGYTVIIGTSRKDAELPRELIDGILVYIDFFDTNILNQACHGVDYVIHLATVNAQKSQEDPHLAVKVNGFGTLNLIHASVAKNVSYFLYFSTAHIYGSPLVGVIDEAMLPKPSHPYSITHRLAEDFLLESINSEKMRGVIFRLSNSIGKPSSIDTNCWVLFVNDICRQAIESRCITINSNPLIERDFIPVSSICSIVDHFLVNRPHSEFPVYNIGSGSAYSLLDIAKLVIQRCDALYGFLPKLVLNESINLAHAPLYYKTDKLIGELGWEFSSDLTPVIDEVLEYSQLEFG